MAARRLNLDRPHALNAIFPQYSHTRIASALFAP